MRGEGGRRPDEGPEQTLRWSRLRARSGYGKESDPEGSDLRVPLYEYVLLPLFGAIRTLLQRNKFTEVFDNFGVYAWGWLVPKH